MKKLNLKTAAKPVRATFAQKLRQTTRKQLLKQISRDINQIEIEFCRQDGRDMRFADEDYNIVLDADCVSAHDFVYQIEVEYPITDTTATENRTLGKISMDCGGGVYLYPRGDEGLNDELEATEMDTDALFRLCDYLDCSLAVIKMDTES